MAALACATGTTTSISTSASQASAKTAAAPAKTAAASAGSVSSSAAAAAFEIQAKDKEQAAPKKRSFLVKQLKHNEQNCKEIAVIVDKWSEISQQYLELSPQKPDELQNAFESCNMVIRGMYECITIPECFPKKYDSIHVCKDSTGIVQGLMLTKIRDIIVELNSGKWENQGKYLNIVYIVTNPFNIRSPLTQQESTRIKGAGTAMLWHAAKLAIQAKAVGLYAEGTFHSTSFYQKFGFKQLAGADGEGPNGIASYLHSYGATFTGPWIISIKEMQALAKQGMKPYSLLFKSK